MSIAICYLARVERTTVSWIIVLYISISKYVGSTNSKVFGGHLIYNPSIMIDGEPIFKSLYIFPRMKILFWIRKVNLKLLAPRMDQRTIVFFLNKIRIFEIRFHDLFRVLYFTWLLLERLSSAGTIFNSFIAQTHHKMTIYCKDSRASYCGRCPWIFSEGSEY